MELRQASRKKVANEVVEYESHYTSGDFRCRLSVTKDGIRIEVTGGAEDVGAPGEEFTFFQKTESSDAAKKIAQSLPALGPEDMVQYGFEKVGYVILN